MCVWGLYKGIVRCVPAGVEVFAACCSATAGLDCQVVVSAETTLLVKNTKKVQCPRGYVMTGCNAFAESGRFGGAKIYCEFLCLMQM